MQPIQTPQPSTSAAAGTAASPAPPPLPTPGASTGGREEVPGTTAYPAGAERPTRAHGCAGPGAGGKDLGEHVRSYLGVIALLTAIWVVSGADGPFWPMWPAIGWGFFVLTHALGPAGAGLRRR